MCRSWRPAIARPRSLALASSTTPTKPSARLTTSSSASTALGCGPLRYAEVRRQEGHTAGRQQGRAENAARVQIRYGLIPRGSCGVEVRMPEGRRMENRDERYVFE